MTSATHTAQAESDEIVVNKACNTSPEAAKSKTPTTFLSLPHKIRRKTLVQC